MNKKWRRWFGWSNSKEEMWTSCRKQYFFHVIGKHEPGSMSQSVRGLQALDPLDFRKGTILHEAIRSVLRSYRDTQVLDLSKAKELIELKFNLIEEHPQDYLTEMRNGVDFDRGRIPKLKHLMLANFEPFFEKLWPKYSHKKILFIDGDEEFLSFQCGGYKVYISPDLVTQEENGSLLVTDWKVGSKERTEAWGREPEESLQLTAYVCWAGQKWEVPPAMIGAEFVYYGDLEFSRVKRTLDEMDQFAEFVEQRSKEMLDVTSPEDFPSNPSYRICSKCWYATICKEGKRVLTGEDVEF